MFLVENQVEWPSPGYVVYYIDGRYECHCALVYQLLSYEEKPRLDLSVVMGLAPGSDIRGELRVVYGVPHFSRAARGLGNYWLTPREIVNHVPKK